MHDGEYELFYPFPHAFDHCFQQRLFGVKVVIECPLGNPEVVQDVLNRHLLIALGIHEPPGHIEDFVAFHSVCLFFDDACHNPAFLSLNRPPVYFYKEVYTDERTVVKPQGCKIWVAGL